MDPTLILGGAQILGGLFGRSSDKKEAARARAWELNQQEYGLLRMKHAANLAGFNPLTALQATGGGPSFGGGGTMAPPLASTELLTNGLRDVVDVVSGNKQRREAEQKLDMELKSIQIDALRSGVKAPPNATTIASRPMVTLGGQSAAASIGDGPSPLGLQRRPQGRPTLMDKGQIPVFGPDGGLMSIPKRWADRLDLKPHDALLIEDYEAIVGDEGGQVAALGKIPATVGLLEGGLFGPSTTEAKAKRVENPYDVRNYVPSFGSSDHVPYKIPKRVKSATGNFSTLRD